MNEPAPKVHHEHLPHTLHVIDAALQLADGRGLDVVAAYEHRPSPSGLPVVVARQGGVVRGWHGRRGDIGGRVRQHELP